MTPFRDVGEHADAAKRSWLREKPERLERTGFSRTQLRGRKSSPALRPPFMPLERPHDQNAVSVGAGCRERSHSSTEKVKTVPSDSAHALRPLFVGSTIHVSASRSRSPNCTTRTFSGCSRNPNMPNYTGVIAKTACEPQYGDWFFPPLAFPDSNLQILLGLGNGSSHRLAPDTLWHVRCIDPFRWDARFPRV